MLFLAVTILWRFVVITVPSGHVGVLWKRFNTFDLYCWCFAGRGTMLNPQQLRGEGLHLIWPWDKLYIYNLRLQSNEADLQRDLQGRRERHRADQHPLPAAQQFDRGSA